MASNTRPQPAYYYQLTPLEQTFHQYTVLQLLGLEEMIDRHDMERSRWDGNWRLYIDDYERQYGWTQREDVIRSFRQLLQNKGAMFYAGWHPDEQVTEIQAVGPRR